MNILEEVAYQIKELNKTLESVCRELSDLTEINEHLGTISTYLASIDDSLEKKKTKDLIRVTIHEKDLGEEDVVIGMKKSPIKPETWDMSILGAFEVYNKDKREILKLISGEMK